MPRAQARRHQARCAELPRPEKPASEKCGTLIVGIHLGLRPYDEEGQSGDRHHHQCGRCMNQPEESEEDTITVPSPLPLGCVFQEDPGKRHPKKL